MNLNETTFTEFIDWCKAYKKNWYPYMTIPRLRVIYDYYVNHNLACKGRNCTVTKGKEWISSFSEPLDYEPTREDYVWHLFHEVWCKTEWAVRCSRSETELGYESVKSELGMSIIKALKEV